jgi:hypothetical protein
MDKQFFICHSGNDSDLAETLVDELEANGYRCWIASRGAISGPNFEKTVTAAILNSSAVLLIFTENTSGSRHIRSELDVATNRKIPIIVLKYRHGSVSESIRYYTHEQPRIDCTFLQSNTPEIISALHCIAKEPVASTHDNANTHRYRWWIVAAAVAVLVSAFLPKNSSSATNETLFNRVVGERNSWDYTSDIVSMTDGRYVAAGGWDWGYWSRLWIVMFDSSDNLVFTWSDSVSGACLPLALPTADGGCLAVYADFSDTGNTGFSFRAVRLNFTGTAEWAIERQVDYPGGDQPALSSLCWLQDSIAVASFTARSPSDNRHAVFLAELDASDGSGSTVAVPGNMETLCMASTGTGRIAIATRNIIDGSTVLRIVSSDGTQDYPVENNTETTLTCMGFCPDSSLIAAGTPDGKTGLITVFKFNEDLSTRWKNSFNEEIQGTASDMLMLPDGDLLVTGTTGINAEGNTDGLLLRLNKSGKLQWKSFIDTGGDDHLLAADAEQNGTLLLAGTTTCFGNHDAWLLRADANGEYNSTCVSGIDVFTENWEIGFVQQLLWITGSGESGPATVTAHEETGNFALDVIAPVVQREPFSMVPGLCFSAEILLENSGAQQDTLWVSFGTTEQNNPSMIHNNTDCELKWNLFPEQEITITCGRVSPNSTAVFPANFNTAKPVLLCIENFEDSVYFRAADSLIFAVPSSDKPDSLRLFANGSRQNSGFSLDNIRVFRKAW